MIPCNPCLTLCLVSAGSFVHLDVVQDGPRTTYTGTVVLEASIDNPDPCIDYTINMAKGRLGGPVISSDPGQPMIPFDHVISEENELDLWWCSVRHASMQMPHSVPRNFTFYVLKTEFGPSDLEKMLADWGVAGSSWDLDLDGVVGGGDLALLLAGWSPDEGAA
jgi:hypothetical protein